MTPQALPTSPEAIRERLLWRVMRLTTAVLVAVCLAYAVAYAVLGRPLLVTLELLACAGGLGIYGLAIRRGDVGFGITRIVWLSWAVLALVVVRQGGLQAPALYWMLALPLLVTLVGLGVASLQTALSAAFVVALYVAQRMDWLPGHTAVAPEHRAISAILITLLFTVSAAMVARWRKLLQSELEAARDDAVRANALKDRFIAHLNHEIRTPVNALATAAETLSATGLTPLQRGLVDAQLASARHLLQLLNDVLDHSRLSAGAFSLEQVGFDPTAAVAEVAVMFHAAAVAKGLQLEVHGSGNWRTRRIGDPGRLRQIVSNLVSNAVKFTPRGRIDIELGSVGEDGPLLLTVRDTGPGMSAEFAQRIFQPYAQQDAAVARRHGGSGLGLAICRELAMLMGGTIEVRTAPGEGSAFTVRLPLPLAPTTGTSREGDGATPQADVAAPPPAVRLLLVEDDEVNRIVVETALVQLGAAVVSVDSGEAALERLHAADFDLVLMDRRLPGVDGGETVRRWRAVESAGRRRRVPIIAVTGDVDAQSESELRSAGVDDIVLKPLSMQTLARCLGAASGRCAGPVASGPSTVASAPT